MPQKLQVRMSSTLNDNDFQSYELDTPFQVNNEHFQGHVIFRVHHPDRPQAYFSGVKRRFSLEVTGKFKHTMAGDELCLACDFTKPLRSLPTGIGLATSFVKWIDPTVQIELFRSDPFLISPVLSALSMVQTCPPDTEIKRDEQNRVVERCLNPVTQIPFATAVKRKAYFQNPKNLAAYQFQPNQVYVFDWFSPYVDFNTFDLQLGIRLKAWKYLGSPIRFSFRDRSKKLVCFALEIGLIND